MYDLSVPIMIPTAIDFNIDKFVEQAKKVQAKRIVLPFFDPETNSPAFYYTDCDMKKRAFDRLTFAIKHFKDAGFEVGTWLWALMRTDKNDFTPLESPNGSKSPDEICPADESFKKLASDFVAELANLGMDFILLDDDFRLGFQNGVKLGCTCPHHMKLISEILGENIKRSDIKDYLLTGGKNKYRSAFIKANKKSLIDFSISLRESVDKVNPNIRIGICSCLTSWDFDGAYSYEVAKALAGNTKPLLRLIGAPYWAAQNGWGCRLGDVIDITRLERSWCPDDIEIIAEGDCWPRPRHYTPASYLEMYDLALRADGSLSGCMKYMSDYYSSSQYETGYFNAHYNNLDLYEKIDEHFSDKNCCGIRVYEATGKYENMEIPEQMAGKETLVDTFFPITSRFLGAASIASKFHGTGVGIAFGDNVKYIPENAAKEGLFLDIDAALILHSKGIDVGIESVGDTFSPWFEKFDNGEKLRHSNVYSKRINLKSAAVVKSNFLVEKEEIPSCYVYKNTNGEQFCVFNFSAYGFNNYNANDSYYKNYEREKQIFAVYEDFSGKKLPCHINKSPYMYFLVKKSDDENAMSVCVFNFSADAVINGVFELDDEYTSIEFLAGSGKLCGNKLTTDKISAFDYLIFEVKK